jgi:hypothetical protein
VTRGNFKANPWPIVRAHWRTYVDVRNERPRWQDWLTFAVPPGVVVGVCVWRDVKLPPSASAALLTVTGLLSAFLFGVITQISARAMDYADSQPRPSTETSAHARNLLELAANAGYASLVCVSAAVVFVVATIGSNWVLRVSSAVGLALGVHMIMVLLMVMRREFLLTQERLNRARTGADHRDSPTGRRKAS